MSNRQDEPRVASDDTVAKQTQNQDAFASNQAVADQAKKGGDEPKEEPTEKSDQEVSESKAVVEDIEDTSSLKKDPITETLTEPTEESRAEPSPEPKSKLVEQAAKESTPQQEAPAPQSNDTATSLASPEKPSEMVESTASAPAESVSDLSPVPDTKDDIAMADAEVPAEPVAAADHVESTQETTMTDAPPATSAEEGTDTIQAASSSTIAKDAAQASPTEPNTADTSMSDAPPVSVKVSRSRSPDAEDGPVAKRAKFEKVADEVEVKTVVEAKASTSQDRMEVDQPANAVSLYLENGDPKPLNHPSLNNNPITEWQARQLRSVLALVKKTKAGSNFKLPVSEMWPQLWAEYLSKVPEPTDINTMEKKLRGELTRYATMGEFKADVDRLVKNSVLFNGEGHEVTKNAKTTREGVFSRMSAHLAVEQSRSEKKEAVKQHPTRHTEQRAIAPPPAPTPAQRPKPPAPSPPPKPPVVESPAFAIPSGNNGVPLIRRDSTKGTDGRAKRPVKPAHSKDLFYDTKRKKKLSPELRFYEEVLSEVRKSRYYDINAPFLQPVDPVALNIPAYHKIVKKPMDLSTMATKMSGGEYLNGKEVERDFELIIKNCKTFNGDSHAVYHTALLLQNLWKKETARKDDWMAKHAPPTAPPSQATTSPRLRDDSDDDEAESDAEPEADAERKAADQRLAGLKKRLDEENKKIEVMMNSPDTDLPDIEISQSVVNMLQKQILAERTKLASMAPKKTSKPSKPSKPKKSGAAAGASTGGNKKTGGGGGNIGAGSAKKASAKKPKRKMGALEKEVIAAGIAELEGNQLERAIEIIKTDTGQGENDSGELELDIEVLSEGALTKLYDIAIKTFPGLRAEKEKTFAAPPQVETPSAKSKAAANKSKKNKPMSRVEQERRIQQLNDLRAQASRHGSGSQEPMESIEGNGRASVDPANQPAQDSEDEESSEEE